MPIFETSYDTTFGPMYNTGSIVTKIKEALIKNGWAGWSMGVRDIDNVRAAFINGQTQTDSEIPSFTHPIVVEYRDEIYLCSDVRLHVRPEADADRGMIRNRVEWNFAKSRAVMSMKWITGSQTELLYGLAFGGTVFSILVSESLKQAFNLDFAEQTRITALSHLYYQSLFMKETKFDEEQRQKMASHTIKCTKIPSEIVLEVMESFEEIKGIDDFCSTLVKMMDNVRLEKFDKAILYTLVRNSWFGANSKEIIPVALEHPPTWLAIVYAALSERSYKNSKISQIAERYGKRGIADEFSKSYQVMMSQACYSTSIEEQKLNIPDYE